MASVSFILGIIGNVISILMFASPIKTFKQIVKKKSTENYNGVPYVTTLLTTSLWTFYGLLKTGGLLIVTVNAAGASLHIIYVALFLFYVPSKIKLKSVVLVGIVNVGFLGVVIMLALLAVRGTMKITVVGILCAGLTIAMYAAPLSAMRTVIKMKSVRYMPFLLSFFQFLNGGVWSAYALLVQDFYIGVPNGIGFLLGSTQLVLYAMYKDIKSSPEESEEEKEEEEEGSAHACGGGIQMQDSNTTNRSASKGNSPPKTSSKRQYSHNILKTLSLTPYQLQLLDQKDIEKGFKESR